MTAPLLDGFDAIVEAPGGVDRLRTAILDLAVAGRLLPQDPAEGDARDLLARLGRAPVASDAALPRSWCWSRLRDLGVIGPRLDVAPDAAAGFVPMSHVPTRLRGAVRFEARPWREIEGYRHLADGDVVMARIAPCFQNRKSAVIAGLPGGVGAGSTELLVFRPASGVIDARYALIFLRSGTFVRGAEPRMTGTAGHQRVPRAHFAGGPVPLPPLGEQRRIVARVDELIARCDALEARQRTRQALGDRLWRSALDALARARSEAEIDEAWARIEDHLAGSIREPAGVSALRQAILRLAVRGRLVPQVPGEVASAPTTLDVPPHPVPAGWAWVRLGDVLQRIEAGVSPSAQRRPRRDDEWGVLKVSACSRGRFLPEQNKALAPGTEPRVASEVRPGDWLVSRANTRALVGRSVVVEHTPPRLLLSDKTLRLVPDPRQEPRYLDLANLAARAHYEAHATGTSDTMLNVSQRTIRLVPVPLPPPAEQRRIVERYARLSAACDALERRLERRQADGVALGASAVHRLLTP